MAIQIFGTNKCRHTRAAIRFFKERRIPFHFVDLDQRDLSDGEFSSIVRAVGLENMIDTEGKEYQRLSLKYMTFDMESKLRENPKLLKTPIVRCGPKAAVGNRPEIWSELLKSGT
jgi:arsenate reductase-like glutaredoxin family protein